MPPSPFPSGPVPKKLQNLVESCYVRAAVASLSCLRFGLVGTLAIGSVAAHAGEPAPVEIPSIRAYTTEDLFRFLEDEIVVTTASQMKTKISEVPQAVYVLTREEIKRLHAFNLADLLRHVPGLIVTNPTSAQWTIGVDATTTLSTGTILVLVDGRAVYLAFTMSNEWWPIPYAPEDIERVEVAMGPSSTVYGSQAIFGVVNFITRDAGEEGFSIKAAGGGSYGADHVGRFGDVRSHTAGTIHLGPARLRIAGGYERLTRWDDAASYWDGRLVPMPDAQRGYVNMRTEIDLGEDTNLTVLSGGSCYEGPYIGHGPSAAFGNDFHADTELRVGQLLGDGDLLSLRSYYRIKRFYFEAPVHTLLPVIKFDMIDQSGLVRALYTAPLPAQNRLAAAVEARIDHTNLEVLLPAGRNYQYLSLVIQDEFRPVEHLIFNGGARLETQLREGLGFFEHLAVMPRVSIVWLPVEGHSLRLAYGQGISFQGGFIEFGNPQLYRGRLNLYESNPQNLEEPTHIWEAGYRGQFSRTLLVTLSYTFRLILSRLWGGAGEDALVPMSFVRFHENQGRHNLDATVSFRPVSVARFDLALSWLIYSDQPEVYKKRAGDPPDWRLSARVHLSPYDPVEVDIDGHFLSMRTGVSALTGVSTKIAASFYLNLRLAYRFMNNPKLKIFGLATNLTDTPLTEGVDAEFAGHGISRIGRRFLLGLGADF